MEREFLKNLDLGGGARLSKEAVDAIMAEHGRTVNSLRTQVGDLVRERDGLQARAEAAEAVVRRIPKDQDPEKLLETLERARTDLADAEKDYDARLAQRELDGALRAELEKIRFTSEAAKRDVAGQLRAAGLTLADGKIVGLEEQLGRIRAQNADAFVDERQQALEAGRARFTQPIGGGPDEGAMTREAIMAIRDGAARRRAIAENIKLFQ